MKYLRTIQDIFKSKSKVKTNHYNFGKFQTKSEEMPLLFLEGLFAIKKGGKGFINCAEDDNYVLPVNKVLPQSYEIGNTLIFEANNPENYILFKDGNIEIKTSKITINQLEIKVDNNKLTINNKEAAVVGGLVDPLTLAITSSGQ